ncbi:MAG: porin, partial [Hyphomicrobiales bacterium]|nr:porin [Hyphomicrobiales bacterium]
YINMDARTQTAWGTVQTVFSVAIRSRSGIFNGSPQNGPGGRNTASPQVYAAYIRFAGFTFGRSPHVFSNGPGYLFYWTNYSGGGAIGTLKISYTAVFGGGFSATLALEDKEEHANQRAGFGGIVGTPNRLPNLVLTLRVDQGWGFARLSGAIGRNYASNGVVTRRKDGWAVGADVRINLPSLARGDAIFFAAAYSNGLIDYVTGGNRANGSVAKDGRITGGWNVANANVTGTATCAVVAGPCALQTWKAWRAMVAFTHFWTPTLRSNFAVSYLKITPPSSITNAAVGFPKSSAWQASGNLIWSPTRGFDIGLEVYYASIRHSTRSAAIAATLAAAGVKKNPNDWAVKLRVQRTF